MTVFLLIAGLVFLTVGAEILVRNASKLSATVGVSPLVIGLTVVAFGTSAPELVVSLQSAMRDQADIALGNVVGSNIFNVLLILGLSAMIVPLRVAQKLIRIDVPLMVGLSFLVLLLGLDGRIGRLDGLLLVSGLIGYTTWSIMQSRKESKSVFQEYAQELPTGTRTTSWLTIVSQCLLVLVGLVILIIGARWFTDSAIEIARQLGVSELVIGLTIVAAGTSLPEVATSILAAVRGERDIAVGNVVGSNIFNILGVLGLAGTVSAEGVAVAQTALTFDIPVMVAVAIACLPVFFTGHVIARWEGALFFAYFCAYSAYLILEAAHSGISLTFGVMMLGFAIPLTVITLTVCTIRAWRHNRGDPPSKSL